MITKLVRNIAFALALMAVPSAASAALIVDTGAPTGNATATLFNTFTGNFQYLAARFHLDSATTLTRLEGFIGSTAGGTFHIGIADGDQAPANTLGQATPTPYVTQATAAASAGDWFGSNVNFAMTAGDWWIYFAVLPANYIGTGNAQDTLSGYMPFVGAPNPLANAAFINHATGAWTPQDALGIGVRIYDNSVATGGVPEPAIWALMIVGFGAAGSMIRRRKAMVA